MIFFYLFQDMKIKIKKYAYIHNSISTYVQEVRKKKCRCCRCKENFKEKFSESLAVGDDLASPLYAILRDLKGPEIRSLRTKLRSKQVSSVLSNY